MNQICSCCPENTGESGGGGGGSDANAVNTRIKQLEDRVKDLTCQVEQLQMQMRENKNADIVCDWLSHIYHTSLVEHTRGLGLDAKNWSDVSVAITENKRIDGKSIKQLCCDFCGLSSREWDCIYTFKRKRNMRCHPRTRLQQVVHILKTSQQVPHIMALRKLCATIARQRDIEICWE